jgi:hypothetical protein
MLSTASTARLPVAKPFEKADSFALAHFKDILLILVNHPVSIYIGCWMDIL